MMGAGIGETITVAALDADPYPIYRALRWASPVGTLTRLTTRPATLAGIDLPAGARVAAVIASANRDEHHWADLDRFDLARTALGHFAFGAGDHFCVGAWRCACSSSACPSCDWMSAGRSW